MIGELTTAWRLYDQPPPTHKYRSKRHSSSNHLFPSPADDYLEGKLDLNEHLIKHKVATFFVRVMGDSMLGAGIHDGDLLVVDRSLEAQDKSVVIAVVNGEFTVKRIKKEQGRVWLKRAAQEFEHYLKTGSGQAFAKKRFW